MGFLKKIFFLNLKILILCILIFDYCRSQAIHPTVLEKTRLSRLVVLAECVDVEGENYSIENSFFPKKPCMGIRYGLYEIREVLKGDYPGEFIRVDYKTTNEKYFPSDGCTFMYPPGGKVTLKPEPGEIVVLYLEEGNSIYSGRQGKVIMDKYIIGLYRDAVLNANRLLNLQGDDRINMIFDNLEVRNKYITDGMEKELLRIIKRKFRLNIAELLKSENHSIKILTLASLNGTKDTSVVPFVIPLLRDSSWRIRSSATNDLRWIQDERTIPALIDAYSDPDLPVRREAIYALSDKHLDESEKYRGIAYRLFCDAIKDNDMYTRVAGVYALGQLRGIEATECLLEASNDDSSDVRNRAILWLSRRGVPSIVEPAGELLFHDNREHIESALACLYYLAVKNLINPERHLHIIQKLRDIVNYDNIEGNRSLAALILGEINDPVFIEMLPDLLYDKSYSLKTTAAGIMRDSKDRNYIPVLKKALTEEEDENIIRHFENALEKLMGN